MTDYTLTTENFNGHDIPTKVYSDGVMEFSLTAMAKAEGKNIYDWKRLPSTIDFLKAIEDSNAQKSDTGLSRIEIIAAAKGGKDQGTWTSDERVAIFLSSWLSPAFNVWMIERIVELRKQGYSNLTRNNVLDLKIKKVIENYNNDINFGKALQALFKELNDKSFEVKENKEALSQVIRAIRGEYDSKDRFFKLLAANFVTYCDTIKSKKFKTEMFLIEKYIEDEHIAYRGRVIGQRERRVEDQTTKTLETK